MKITTLVFGGGLATLGIRVVSNALSGIKNVVIDHATEKDFSKLKSCRTINLRLNPYAKRINRVIDRTLWEHLSVSQSAEFASIL